MAQHDIFSKSQESDGDATPGEDGPPSDLDGGEEDPEALNRTKSTRSVAETLPWYRELLFVAVICLAQLFTRESFLAKGLP